MANYVIFGAGRVGQNMSGYLTYLGHHCVLISHHEAKSDPDRCRKAVADAEFVAAAIPDDAIAAWCDHWIDELHGKIVIHFSGAARVDGVAAFHPLYSFPPHKVDAAKLEQIAFACPQGGPAFGEVFPGAPNPHFEIADADRARYHALAVLSGNFVAFLWNETAKELAQFTGLEPEVVMGGYLASVIDRFRESPAASLTGPVARKDAKTVAANLDALTEKPALKRLYEAFLKEAWSDYPS